MRSPEDLIGRKPSYNDSNKRNDKKSYVPRYSTKHLLAEAALIANEPTFIVARRDNTKISIVSSITTDNKVLLPINRESYFPTPYSFSSEQQVYEYVEKVRRLTLSDLYYETISFCSLFIDADSYHRSILATDITFTYFQDLLGRTIYFSLESQTLARVIILL